MFASAVLTQLSCTPDLADLEAMAAVSNFEFIALAPNERRALEIDLPDVLQVGDTEREFDLSEFAYPDGLNLYVGRGLDVLVTQPWGLVDGILPCQVREIWHATAGEVVITSAEPIYESESGVGLYSSSIKVSVSDVMIEDLEGGDPVQAGSAIWTVELSVSYGSSDGYGPVHGDSPCHYPD